MSIKSSLFNLSFAALALAGFSCLISACGDDSSSTSEEEFGYSPSSSSISNRADIDYRDTVILGKKLDLNIELEKGKDEDRDSSELYIDSTATSIPMYIGELPSGSRIKVKASTNKIENDMIRIRSEHGEKLQALTPVAKTKDHLDSSFVDYLKPSFGTIADSTYKDSNLFVVFTPNHYYLEIAGQFSDESTARLYIQVDTAYYRYTGEGDSISLAMNDSIHGIVRMGDDAPENINIKFSAEEGFSLNLIAQGKNIDNIELLEGDSLLGNSTVGIDTMLIPNDSAHWTLKIAPESFTSIWSGPFAYFTATTTTRRLEKGEYFTNPDSIQYPGEYLITTRPKDLPSEAIYRYNLRQEQFVWLGDYKKGDSISIMHDIKNYSKDNFESPVTYEILNSKKKVLGTISSTYGGDFKIPADGPYYLHYIRLNSKPQDQGIADSLRYVLQLYTLVQQPGLLKDMSFFDVEMDETIETMNVSTGDTLRFNRFSFNFTPVKATSWKEIGSNVQWYVPCESLKYISREIYDVEKCNNINDNGEQLISSDFLTVSTDDEAVLKEALLIAESVADPTMRDTLKISIKKAAN